MPIYALGSRTPDIHRDAFVHPDAVVIGDVRIGAHSSIWPCAVLRGDYGTVTLSWASGTASNIYSAVFPSDQPASFSLPDVPRELSAYAPSTTSAFSSVTVAYVDEETAKDYAQSSIFQTQPAVDGLGMVFSGGSNTVGAP